MEQKVIEIFKKVFNQVEPTEVTLDSEFREWDQFSSLTLATLLAEIEDEFQIKFKLISLVNAETIGDVVDAVEERL